jgi:hypothetical protein
VEHPCQQCGAAVEDGRPFCPHCRAPQIHVQVTATETPVSSGLNPAANEFSQEISQTAHPDRPGTPAGTIDRAVAIRAALKAGVLGVFIGMIPLLGIVLTGALGVFFYHRENKFALPAALASRVGGAAGVVAFAINSVLITIQVFVFHAQQKYADDIMTIAQRFGANVVDPDMQASIHNLFTPAGLAVTLFFGMVVTIVLASVGGALASFFLRPRTRM